MVGNNNVKVKILLTGPRNGNVKNVDVLKIF